MRSHQVQSASIHELPQREKRNFHGAAILDQNGVEVPMTSDMIDKALKQVHGFLWPRDLALTPQCY